MGFVGYGEIFNFVIGSVKSHTGKLSSWEWFWMLCRECFGGVHNWKKEEEFKIWLKSKRELMISWTRVVTVEIKRSDLFYKYNNQNLLIDCIGEGGKEKNETWIHRFWFKQLGEWGLLEEKQGIFSMKGSHFWFWHD